MSLVNPYCTIQQVQSELRNEDDALLTQIEDAVNQASRWIDWYMRRDYYQHDHSTLPIYATRQSGYVLGNYIHLPYAPVISIASVYEGTTALTEDEDFTVSEADGVLYRVGANWPLYEVPTDGVIIKGVFGFAQSSSTDVPTGLPSQITRACVMLAAAFSGHNRVDSIGLDGSVVTLRDKDIPKAVFDTLGKRGPMV